MKDIVMNSNFYHGDFDAVQIGGPEEWEVNGGKPNWRLNQDEIGRASCRERV